MPKPLPPVLMAAMALDLGGAETHVISLARELKRLGHTVKVASAGGRLVPLLAEAGIDHFSIAMDSRNPIVMYQSYQKLRQLIRQHGIGLVHAHARIPAYISSLALAGQGIPFVTTYHGVYAAGFPWKLMTRFGQRTIAVSEDVRRHLIGPLGAPADQVRVIPNGFDTSQFHPHVDIAPLLAEFGLPAGGMHVVNAGRLDEDLVETTMALVRAMPEVERRIPGVTLWILGDGRCGADVRRQAEETNRQLGRRAVVATGVRLDVPRFFNLADCVVAVGRTALEAMACERPVVVSGLGGYRGIMTPESIDEFRASNFTARNGGQTPDPAKLARDVVQLLSPEAAAERQRFGEAGRRFVVENLSIEAVTARILDVYAEVL